MVYSFEAAKVCLDYWLPELARYGYKTEVTAMVNYDDLIPSGFISVKLPASILASMSIIVTVRDETMADFDLHLGDEIFVRLQSSFRNADTVLMELDGKICVKSYFKDRKGVEWFMSPNKDVKPVPAYRCCARIVGLVERIERKSVRYDIDFQSLIEEQGLQDVRLFKGDIVSCCIRQIAPMVTTKRLWFAVYRVLTDNGVVAETDWQGFVDVVRSAVPDVQLLVTDLRRLNVGCFARPLRMWSMEKSPYPRSYNDYYRIAMRFTEMLEQ